MGYKYIFSLHSGLEKIKSIKTIMYKDADTAYRINKYCNYYRFDHYPKGDGFIYVEADFNDCTYFLLKDFDSLYRLIDKFINDFNNGDDFQKIFVGKF